MRHNLYHFLILGLCSLISCKSIDCISDKQGFTSIFNGKDLTGWQVKIAGYPLDENMGNTFRVEDGILKVRYDAPEYSSFNNQFGSIYTIKPYKDFHLRVIYRFVGETCPGAPDWGYRDSGIQFYCQNPTDMEIDQAFPVCLEYNLHGGNGVDDRPVGEICANGMYIDINGQQNPSYCNPPEVKRTFHGDQWVTLEIKSEKGQITHFVNGEKIISYSNPRLDSKHEVAKKLIEKNGDSSVHSGYISLQSNSHPIDFKKIEIKIL